MAATHERDNFSAPKYVHLKLDTVEQTWTTFIAFFLTVLLDSFLLLTCLPVAVHQDEEWEAIDSDFPPTTDSTLHYWLASSVAEVP